MELEFKSIFSFLILGQGGVGGVKGKNEKRKGTKVYPFNVVTINTFCEVRKLGSR